MTALDGPVAAVDHEQTFRVCFVRLPAGDAVSCFTGGFPALLVRGLPFDHESLSYVGKVEVAIQFGGRPYAANLDPSVISRSTINEVRFSSVAKGECDVIKEPGLIAFHREVVMALTPNYVGGDVPLGEKGISSDVLALDVDGIKERNGCLDLVGLFDFFACYPEAAHFFWV